MVCIPLERLRKLWWKHTASHPITQGSEMPIHAASYWSRALGINCLTFVCKPTRGVLLRIKTTLCSECNAFSSLWLTKLSSKPNCIFLSFLQSRSFYVAFPFMYVLSQVPGFRENHWVGWSISIVIVCVFESLTHEDSCTSDFQCTNMKYLISSPSSSSKSLNSLEQVSHSELQFPAL